MPELDLGDLFAYLKTCKPGPFKPVPRYSHKGDMLEVHFEDEPAYAEPLSETVTLLRAMSDRRIVGVKVFDVAPLVRAAAAKEG